MAKSNVKRYFRKHVSARTGVTFTVTVRVKGFDSVSRTFHTKAEAADWAATHEQTLLDQKKEKRGAARRDMGRMTVSDLMQIYLQDPKTTAQRTYDSTCQMAAWWIEHYGATKMLEFNSALTLREAREKLMRGRKPGTCNRYFTVMRRVWNWARENEIIPANRPWPTGLMLAENNARTRFLSDGELATLLNVASARSAQMHTMIIVAIATGLRRGELLRLDWADIDLAKQTLVVHISKNGTKRTVHLPEAACAALRGIKGDKVVAIGGPVFTGKGGTRMRDTTLEGRWRPIIRASGLRDFHWHDLRHTCASYLAQAGGTLVGIAEQLGHKSLSVTLRYAHMTQGAATPAHAALDAKLSQR